jgi:hypothetical protein
MILANFCFLDALRATRPPGRVVTRQLNREATGRLATVDSDETTRVRRF